ncbi:hypothetical protein IJJ97_05340 [bacterium]|nr:hypothetical protein [bacterium]
MWASDKEHLQYLAEQMVELKAERFDIGLWSFISGVGFTLFFEILMWLLHR